MITSIRPRTFVCWLGAVALLVLAIVLVVNLRVSIATAWWDQTNSLPEVVLFVSQDPELGVRMGNYHFENDQNPDAYDIRRAQRLYDRALAMDESIVWALYQRGRIAFLYGEYEEALYYLRRYQDRTEIVRPQAIYLEGVVLGFAGEAEASLRVLQEYYEYDSNSWYIHNNLAWTYFKLGNFMEMDAISAAGLEKHPTNPWLLMNRGLAQHNLGNATTAVEYIDESYEYATSLGPDAWSRTYPGNDPAVAATGLAEFLSILEANRKLIHKAK